jgi:hypothetical protein
MEENTVEEDKFGTSEEGNDFRYFEIKDLGEDPTRQMTREEFNELPNKSIRLFDSIAGKRLEEETWEEYTVRKIAIKQKMKAQKKGIHFWKAVTTREINGKMYQMGNTYDKAIVDKQLKEIIKKQQEDGKKDGE